MESWARVVMSEVAVAFGDRAAGERRVDIGVGGEELSWRWDAIGNVYRSPGSVGLQFSGHW